MKEERLKILEMLQAGKISVDEATQLLEVAEQPQAGQPIPVERPRHC